MSKSPLIGVGTFLVILALGSASRASATEKLVLVHTASGRSFSGEVDIRSDQQTLWLRFDHGASRIWRPIAWSAVTRIEQSGRAITKDEALSSATRAPDRPQRVQIPLATGGPSMADQADRLLAGQPRVAGIEFDAGLANWDEDAASDGLVVRLRIYDVAGRSLPVAGNMEVRLMGVRYRTARSGARRHRSSVETIGRWTRAFSAEQMTNGAQWRLPFQANHPQWDRSWKASGLVVVTVTIPGHGTFTASRDFIRTRPISPTRDEQARVTGSPFFAGERTGR